MIYTHMVMAIRKSQQIILDELMRNCRKTITKQRVRIKHLLGAISIYLLVDEFDMYSAFERLGCLNWWK